MPSLRSSEDVSCLISPLNQSTPKKKKEVLTCPHCPKTYQVRHYYDKHVLSHGISENSQVAVDISLSKANDSQTLNISDLSIISYGEFKLPAAPGPEKRKVGNTKKVCNRSKGFICTYCLKSYVSDISMKKHMRIRTMQVSASRFPGCAQIMLNKSDLTMKALTEVSYCPSYGTRGQIFRELLGEMSCYQNVDAFSTPIIKKLAGFIDKIRSVYYHLHFLSILMGKWKVF